MGVYSASETYKSVILPVDVPAARPLVIRRALRDMFRPKVEHHITIVSGQTGSALPQEKFRKLEQAVASLDKPAVEFGTDLFYISKAKVQNGYRYDREALVVPVMSDDITTALGRVATDIGAELPEPFLHVTMFTRPNSEIARRGIGIDSADEWHQLNPQLYAELWHEAV
jgi:hypothetical protein